MAQGLSAGGVDAVAVAGRLSGDATLHLHDAFTTPHARSTFEIFGTEASALATDAMSQTPDGEVVLRRDGQEGLLVDVGERENLYVRGLRTFAGGRGGSRGSPVHRRGRGALPRGRPGRHGVADNRSTNSLGIAGDIA